MTGTQKVRNIGWNRKAGQDSIVQYLMDTLWLLMAFSLRWLVLISVLKTSLAVLVRETVEKAVKRVFSCRGRKGYSNWYQLVAQMRRNGCI